LARIIAEMRASRSRRYLKPAQIVMCFVIEKVKQHVVRH